jgi:hypothetical protein
MLSWSLNAIGLAFGIGGAFWMYFRPPVHMPVNFLESGYLIGKTPNGRRALKARQRVAGVGVALLSLGFALQLCAALVARFVEHTAV